MNKIILDKKEFRLKEVLDLDKEDPDATIWDRYKKKYRNFILVRCVLPQSNETEVMK